MKIIFILENSADPDVAFHLALKFLPKHLFIGMQNEKGYSFCTSRQFCLFVCFVALCPKPTAKVTAGQSVHLTTLLPGQACTSG